MMRRLKPEAVMMRSDPDARSRSSLRRCAIVPVRHAARRLELRSFSLFPEHFNHVEGYRAAAAVAAPLILAVSSGRAELSWAVFGAFWTCLCDVPGPDRLRRRLLAIFVCCGAFIALAGSWFASLTPLGGMLFGPLFVLVAILGSARIAYGGLVGTLLAVVAVVAVGFPHVFEKALFQAAAFSTGAGWAWLLINVLWRVDPLSPLQRACEAIVIRLLDMIESLIAIGAGAHRDERWHSDNAEHRRAVRLSIERLRALLGRYGNDGSSLWPFQRALAAAEIIFSAAIALDQTFIDRSGSRTERLVVARTFKTTLLSWHLALRRAPHGPKAVKRAAANVRNVRAKLTEDAFVGCALALENALEELTRSAVVPGVNALSHAISPEPAQAIGATVVRQALRQSAGLVAVYLAAAAFHLGYPYWAAMAVVVVLQGGARVTWARGLERILGSMLGGAVALAVLHLTSSHALLSIIAIALAAAAISLRSVNYTIFVVFLTMLFVIVTEMLQPGVGIASARVLDNVVGSVAALLAVFLLWPDFGASLEARIEEGLAANRIYFEAVQAEKSVAEIEIARRVAGLASVEAEIALHDVGGSLFRFRSQQSDTPTLQAIRNIAGRAAIAWHRRLAAEGRAPPEE